MVRVGVSPTQEPLLTPRILCLVHLETPPMANDDDGDTPAPSGAAASAPSAVGPSKYVPPSMRNRGPGESMGRPGGSRDDLPTLRVTNISEDTQENDLRDLFGTFGRVARVYVGRDRETGIGKGFAFISFEDKSTAQKAMDKMHGRGYDSLILNVQWSRTCLPFEKLRCQFSDLPFYGMQNQGSRDRCAAQRYVRSYSFLCIATGLNHVVVGLTEYRMLVQTNTAHCPTPSTR